MLYVKVVEAGGNAIYECNRFRTFVEDRTRHLFFESNEDGGSCSVALDVSVASIYVLNNEGRTIDSYRPWDVQSESKAA